MAVALIISRSVGLLYAMACNTHILQNITAVSVICVGKNASNVCLMLLCSKKTSGDGASKEYEVLSSDITSSYPIRFAVRSLGWIPIAEDQLTQENSSRAVNQCIVSLSSGLRDINDVVGKWGDVSFVLFISFHQCCCRCGFQPVECVIVDFVE